jgi:ATP-binding protein involved in chromosome partitioning
MKKAVIVCGLKGGTGKSAVAALLGTYISQQRDVILIDADVDSPNLAELLRLQVGDKIKPDEVPVAHTDNLDLVSLGLYVKDKAISMSGDAYVQLLLDVITHAKWRVNIKDAITIIDAPAGASNVFKGVIKAFADSLVGVVVVITPGAPNDLKRLLKIIKYYDLPVVGVIENMAYFECECGRQYSFSAGEIEEICKEFNVDYLGKLPLSHELYEVLQTGIPYIPDVAEPILNVVYQKIEAMKPVGRGILEKITKKVKESVRKGIAKIIAKSVLRVNREIDLKRLTAKGFGGNVIQLIVTDNGKEVTEAYLKLTDGKLVVIKQPKKVDLTIIAELSTLLDAALGKIDLEDAYFMGEVEVYGKGGTVRALAFFEEIWPVIKGEIRQVVEGEGV